jgi:hypothetical protein
MKTEQEAFTDLQSEIMSSCGLNSQEATGFYALYCPMCKKENKKTGGFKFESDKIVYNCFRGSCDASTVYECGEYIPRRFKDLLKEIDVKIPLQLRGKKTDLQKTVAKELNREIFEPNTYKDQKIPDGWIPFEESSHRSKDRWEDHFLERACTTEDVFIIETGAYRGKCAIGMYYFDKLIGFQIVTGNSAGTKYVNESINDDLLYIPERKPSSPTIIVEGLLDAKCFPNTTGTLNSRLTPRQAYHIKDREFWFLPDRKSNHFLEQMKLYPNSKLVVPKWDVKDLNEAVIEYGIMETAERIRNGLCSTYNEAKVHYELWRDRS